MNAVVMELKDGKAAVLTAEGNFECIKDSGYTVGQKIDVDASAFAKADVVSLDAYKGRKKRSVTRRIAAVAAVFVAIVTASLVTSYAVPCTVVTMDINPSISLSLNVYDKVISVDAYNDDGANIASSIKSRAKGRGLDYAVGIALDALRDGSYIDGEDTDIVTSVNSRFKKPDGAEKVMARAVDDWNKNAMDDMDVSVALECIDVPSDVAKEAREKKVSPAKLAIVREVKAKKPPKEFNEDEWMKKSVKEINEVRRPQPPSNQTNTVKKSSTDKTKYYDEDDDFDDEDEDDDNKTIVTNPNKNANQNANNQPKNNTNNKTKKKENSAKKSDSNVAPKNNNGTNNKKNVKEPEDDDFDDVPDEDDFDEDERMKPAPHDANREPIPEGKKPEPKEV